MSLEMDIRNLLRTNEVKQINFSLNNLVISGFGFHELSNCFSDQFVRNRIRVTVNPAIVHRSAEAQYDQYDDKINVRSEAVLNSLEGKSFVVHECVHALQDLRGMSDNIFNSESVAYVGQAWFLIASGMSEGIAGSIISQRFISIAKDLKRQGQTGNRVAMTPSQTQEARIAVRDDHGYGPGHYTYNGVRGHRYRGD